MAERPSGLATNGPEFSVASYVRADGATRVAFIALAITGAFLLPSLVAAMVDAREVNGASVWAKPIKFQLSLGLLLATLAILLRFLSTPLRESALVRWTMVIGATAAIAEIAYITLQAARGRASHFNSETAWEAAGYSAMGVAAVAIVIATLFIGILIFVDRARSDRLSGAALGAALGLILGSIGTLVVGLALGAGNGHWIGGDQTDATGLPLVGWSTTGGDLRVSHFFATHAMQVLPVLGWLSDRIWATRAKVLVCLAAPVYACLVAATFVQARAGEPFIPW